MQCCRLRGLVGCDVFHVEGREPWTAARAYAGAQCLYHGNAEAAWNRTCGSSQHTYASQLLQNNLSFMSNPFSCPEPCRKLDIDWEDEVDERDEDWRGSSGGPPIRQLVRTRAMLLRFLDAMEVRASTLLLHADKL